MPAHTANEMIPAIGQGVTVRFEDLHIHCTVRDVKSSYGRIRLLVSPVSGNGSQWVEPSRIRANNSTNTLERV